MIMCIVTQYTSRLTYVGQNACVHVHVYRLFGKDPKHVRIIRMRFRVHVEMKKGGGMHVCARPSG